MLTHLYIKDYGGIDAMIGYIHYQVVQTKLYIPLEMFRSSKHLTSIMLDITLSVLFLWALLLNSLVLTSFPAIEHIHEAGIFHHDLSTGNTMIDGHGHRRPIDFDLTHYQSKTGAQQALQTVSLQLGFMLPPVV